MLKHPAMPIALTSSNISPRLSLLVAIYFLASLAHFTHNAQYIAFYPNMPAGLTREQVYLVWCAISCVGVSGIALVSFGREVAGLVCLSTYGALGLDGLGHYSLALCSEHTLAMNLTIWSEVSAGAALAVWCGALVMRSSWRSAITKKRCLPLCKVGREDGALR